MTVDVMERIKEWITAASGDDIFQVPARQNKQLCSGPRVLKMYNCVTQALGP